jgi:hypothetical protein
LADAVELPEDAELLEDSIGYWVAWHNLTADRPLGALGGAGRIPWSAIDRYAERNHFEDVDLLARMLWAMDDVYLAWVAEKAKSKTKPES